MGAVRSFAEFRLPPGRHGLAREEVARNQRWRLLGATAEVVAEHGYLHSTASAIAEAAGVSRTTFYEHFDGLPATLLATYEMSADCVVEAAESACESGLTGDARLRESVDAVLSFLAAEPALASLFRSDLAAGVADIATARQRLVERLSSLLAGAHPAAAKEPGAAETVLIGGILSVIADQITRGEAEELPSLAPALVQVLSSPYLAMA